MIYARKFVVLCFDPFIEYLVDACELFTHVLYDYWTSTEQSYVREISLKGMDKSTYQTTTGTAKRKPWAFFLEHIIAEYRQTP